MIRKVYIETTIPCFYYEVRREPEMIARKNWTREWWDSHSNNFELVTSEAVLDELNSGDYPNKMKILSLIDNLSLLSVEEAIFDIVETYINHRVMPQDPAGDALHLA